MPSSISLTSSSPDPSNSIQPPQMKNQQTSVPTISLVSSYITGEEHTIQNICSNSISNLFTHHFYIYVKTVLKSRWSDFSRYNKINSQFHLDINNKHRSQFTPFSRWHLSWRVTSSFLTKRRRSWNLLTKCDSFGSLWLMKQFESGPGCQWRLCFSHRNAQWTRTPPPATAMTKWAWPTHFYLFTWYHQ